MLFLSEKDIKNCLSFNECMDAVEKAYELFYKNDFYMPPRPCIEHNEDTLLYMPCFIPEVFGTKFLTLFPNNPSKGKPFIDGLIVLNNGDDGETKAIMNGRFVTAIRTGANSGVGIKYTTRKDASTCGLIGAGVQGLYQMIYACYARNIERVYVFDAYTKDFSKFLNSAKDMLPKNRVIDIIIVDNVEDLVRQSQIIICATTSKTPVLPNDSNLLKGKNIIAIGSYKKSDRECPDALFEVVDNVYTDLNFAKEESGDLYTPIKNGLFKSEDVIQLSDLIYDEKYQNHQIGETTFYKPVGMALFDIVVGEAVYQNAIKKNIGVEVEL
ncbi:MAG: ornithine cyclodeaminase family protein [Erysipelotrichaceae bacterium]